MDDKEVLTATLNNTLQRYGRSVQNYEIEIANLTAELVRLKSRLETVELEVTPAPKTSAK
jgi:hypothetical protein